MNAFEGFAVASLIALLIAAGGCSETASEDARATGGKTSTGGTAASGGAKNTGGATSGGGTTSSGGSAGVATGGSGGSAGTAGPCETIPVYRTRVPTNTYDPGGWPLGKPNPPSGTYANKYGFFWNTYQSSVVPSERHVDFGGEDEPAFGSELWGILKVKFAEGSPGRMLNFHVAPTDAPLGWDTGKGVSSIAFDWFEGSTYDGFDGLGLTLEAEGDAGFSPYHFQIIPESTLVAGRGSQTYELVYHVTFGRRGETVPGAFQIWVDGKNVVDLSNVNTVNPEQDQVWIWEGQYDSSGMKTPGVMEMAASRMGKSFQDALDDGTTRPIAHASQWGGLMNTYQGGTEDATTTALAAWPAEIAIPSGLSGQNPACSATP